MIIVRWNRKTVILTGIFILVFLASSAISELTTENGWLSTDGKVVWGVGQHNGWWGSYRSNITRKTQGEIGPNKTEDLDKLTSAMLEYGYPAFEHCYGLWYDRRRDDHSTSCRGDANVKAPFLELPWARSTQGTACDGKPKYDLSKYNDWYFERLKEFARLCDQKGTILIHNFYMQHNLLETNAHYVDFPWRPGNNIQNTGLPNNNPVANAFYDTTNAVRNELHKAYIYKCLNVLGDYHNVVHLVSEEYTGGKAFIKYWLNTVRSWEEETGKKVKVGLNGTKDVLDALKDEEDIFMLDLRYFWYEANGNLYAPQGGTEVPGRYVSGGTAAGSTSPEQVYRQIKEYRGKHPNKALLHAIIPDRKLLWGFLMGGGSILLSQVQYEGASSNKPYPTNEYIAPTTWGSVQHTYEFIGDNLPETFLKLKVSDKIKSNEGNVWCLADSGVNYLVYSLHGKNIQLDLTDDSAEFDAKWLDPRTGNLSEANGGMITGGDVVIFDPPSNEDWALWLNNKSVVTAGNKKRVPGAIRIQADLSENFVSISFSKEKYKIDVYVYNHLGKEIFSCRNVNSGRVKWNTSNLYPGIYMIRIKTPVHSYSRKVTLLKY
ncbi:MAG: T9SS type A sorting domain-containing protein [Fibrobacteria bacterium]|nr:T9SS type A sorting domain-containing protein [Fibrobacteria bacterium]